MTKEKEQAALEKTGDRIGAEHRLGGRVAAWNTMELRPHVGCGCVIVVAGIFFGWIPVFLVSAHYRLAAAEVLGGLVVGAALMPWVPPRWQGHGLFQFEHGLVLAGPKKTALTVLRWDDLASIRSGELIGHAGQTVEVGRYGATEEILAVAEKLLTRRLLPALTARYDAGEPVRFGLFTIERRGLSAPGAESGMWWRASWREVSRVIISGHGDRVTVHRADGTDESARLGGEPNSFLARHVIEHAARRAGVAVPVGQAYPADHR